MEVHHLSANRLLLSLSPVTLSVLFTSCSCLFRSLMGQSPLLRDAHLLQPGLSLIRGLMRQSPLLRDAHLLHPGLSLVRGLMGTLICSSRLLSDLLCFVTLVCSSRASLWSGVSCDSLVCLARLTCSSWASLWSGVSDANRSLL